MAKGGEDTWSRFETVMPADYNRPEIGGDTWKLRQKSRTVWLIITFHNNKYTRCTSPVQHPNKEFTGLITLWCRRGQEVKALARREPLIKQSSNEQLRDTENTMDWNGSFNCLIVQIITDWSYSKIFKKNNLKYMPWSLKILEADWRGITVNPDWHRCAGAQHLKPPWQSVVYLKTRHSSPF